MPSVRVEHLVTLGSPLSKAEVLLARRAAEFDRLLTRREAPTAPPMPEGSNGLISYPLAEPVRAPHHGAVFAPVVWTNLYFPSFFMVGDIVSGAVRHLFGGGVLDVRLPIGLRPRVRHLRYWSRPGAAHPPARIARLRPGRNLHARDPDALWANAADGAEIRIGRDGRPIA